MPSTAPTTAPAAWQKDSSACSEHPVRAGSGTDPAAQDAFETCAQRVRTALGMGTSVVLACDPQLEGVLAAVGVSYLTRMRPAGLRLAGAVNLQPQLGEEVVRVPDANRSETIAFSRRVLVGFAKRVTAGCRKRRNGVCPSTCENDCVRRIAIACASDDPAMPEVVHQYLRLGFAEGPRARTLIADPRVAAFDTVARHVLNECEHMRQFVRFSHMSDGSYVASFAPNANTLELTAPHFAARMGTERFCLVDTRHLIAAFHSPGERRCTLVQLDESLAHRLAERRDLASDEAYVRAMWQHFYQGTGTPGRDKSQRGYDLRMHWMPKRLWDGLTELDPHTRESLVSIPQRYTGEHMTQTPAEVTP